MISKIKILDELGKICGDLRAQSKILVTANGVFDLIHPGHVFFLEEAKSAGNILVVGINSDNSVKQN